MDFISNSEVQVAEMLAEIGVDNVEKLFEDIPLKLRYPRPTEDDGMSELEVRQHMEQLANKNTFASRESYLGAGAYEHYIPAVVASLTSRGEFLTAYTPYQPEVSQGLLQAIFEYQSVICNLTGMDVANASLYDAASACAEACLLALRSNKEATKIFVAESLHPHYRAVIEQYLMHQNVAIHTLPTDSMGNCDPRSLGGDVAAVLVQYPNFFGGVEDLRSLMKMCKERGILGIMCANPLVFGAFASASEMGVDIVVGDTQPFGIPLNFGGAYAGYIACKRELMRQLPGRIIGETVDTHGRPSFVITLQAREQHIRREKATSNICTNQAHAALSSLIAMLWYGKEGIPQLALANYQRAQYLREQLLKLPGIHPFNSQTTFNEFTIRFDISIDIVLLAFYRHNIEPGVPLRTYGNCLLVAVTECKNKEQLDRYVEVARELVS